MKNFKTIISLISMAILIALFIALANLNSSLNDLNKLKSSVNDATGDRVYLECDSNTMIKGSTMTCTLKGHTDQIGKKGILGKIQQTEGIELSNINTFSWHFLDGSSFPNVLLDHSDSEGTLNNDFSIISMTVTATSSGNASISFIASEGHENPVIIDQEDNQSEVSSAIYNISIEEPKSSESRLETLSVTGGASISLKDNTLNYSVTVGNSVNSTKISATTKDPKARILEGTGNKTLNVGDNIFNIIVMAEDGVTKSTYTLNIHRDISAENRLTSLIVSNTDISKKFNIDVTNYSETVVYGTTTASITAVSLDSSAKISLDGTVSTGTLSATKNLNIGANNFKITVTAPNGATKEYNVKIIRESKDGSSKSSDSTLKKLSVSNLSLTPAFKSTIYEYTATVENKISTIKITAEANNAKASIPATSVGTKALKEGQNIFQIKVTAENGSDTTYTLKIKRKTKDESSDSDSKDKTTPSDKSSKGSSSSSTINNDQTKKVVKKNANSLLNSLTINNKSIMLSDSVYKYNFSVLNNVTKLNVVAVPKSNKSTVSIDKPDKLKVGQNTVTIKVVAEDTRTTTYKINVTRKDVDEDLDDDSRLSSMFIENYDINFDPDIYEYEVKIKNENSLDLSYVASGINTNIIVKNNEDLKNGSVVSIIVTAEDGVTTSQYNITVKKGISPLVIIIPIMILLVAGLCVYLFIFKKKKLKNVETNNDQIDDESADFEEAINNEEQIEEKNEETSNN